MVNMINKTFQISYHDILLKKIKELVEGKICIQKKQDDSLKIMRLIEVSDITILKDSISIIPIFEEITNNQDIIIYNLQEFEEDEILALAFRGITITETFFYISIERQYDKDYKKFTSVYNLSMKCKKDPSYPNSNAIDIIEELIDPDIKQKLEMFKVFRYNIKEDTEDLVENLCNQILNSVDITKLTPSDIRFMHNTFELNLEAKKKI